MQADCRSEQQSDGGLHAFRTNLQAKIAALQQPETYPERPARIETLETHKSVIFLTDRHAYKLKKPILYNSVDFTSLAARRADCLDEVRLNRRLAGDIYLGIVPLNVARNGRILLNAEGEIIEWLVKMQRLPAHRMLDYLIKHGELAITDVRAVAELLAGFYKNALPAGISGEQYRNQLEREMSISYRDLSPQRYNLPVGVVEAVYRWLYWFLSRESDLFDGRVSSGTVVEGHGDLRPAHVCLMKPPKVFDCLEFDPQLRIVDAADELAFLGMECERAGADWVSQILLDTYEEVTGDHPPLHLIAFYKSYRAYMWARLAIWRTRELERTAWTRWLDRANEYLRIAEQYSHFIIERER